MNKETSKNLLLEYAHDILHSEGMDREKSFPHHGKVSCYDHSIRVAMLSLRITAALSLPVDRRNMVRGALLHDYYLYDWHERGSHTGLHGFNHATIALKNAEQDFLLNEMQRDIIRKHMFPMNPALPRYREAWVVSLADKLCAIREMWK